MENKIYTISKDELNGLLYFYYECLKGLENSKGLKYKQFFQVKQSIIKCGNYLKDKNINDFINVEGC